MWCSLGGGEKTPLISALLLSAAFHGNVLAKLDVSPLGKQHVLIQSQWRERAYDYNGLLLAIIGMKQTLRRDLETCELEMSAVHHSILQPAFSLQEKHGCLRITYTDASLHLHGTVLLLLEQKPLLEKKSRPPPPKKNPCVDSYVYRWTLFKYQSFWLDIFITLITVEPRNFFSLFWTHKRGIAPWLNPLFLSFVFHHRGPSLTFSVRRQSQRRAPPCPL